MYAIYALSIYLALNQIDNLRGGGGTLVWQYVTREAKASEKVESVVTSLTDSPLFVEQFFFF